MGEWVFEGIGQPVEEEEDREGKSGKSHFVRADIFVEADGKQGKGRCTVSNGR